MEKFEGTCPYCGQAVMDEGDPREVCGCAGARKYRKIIAALEKQSERAKPMPVIDGEIMDAIRGFAHLICARAVDGITVKLADRTTVVIGAKVKRSARLLVEEKVEE